MTEAALALSAPPDAAAACLAVMQRHGKTFALAGRLFPRDVRDDAAVLYAFCRRADDAVDLAPAHAQPEALASLRREVDDVYEGRVSDEPTLTAFAALVRRRGIPRSYVDELVAGMDMDVSGATYASMEDLYLYAHRVAGVVGLMMCHVMGVSRADALAEAAHLGVAMQLTNIARDVREDWERGRLYLPASLLSKHGAEGLRPGTLAALEAERGAVAQATGELLDLADRHYARAEAGFDALPFSAALACRAAREVYAAIGDVVRGRRCDPLAPRAVVSKERKAGLVALAVAKEAARAPRRWVRPFRRVDLVERPFASLAYGEAGQSPRTTSP